MSLFHRHQWEVVARRHVPGARNIAKTFGYRNPAELSEILNGTTVIEQRCAGCGRTEFTTVAGDHR